MHLPCLTRTGLRRGLHHPSRAQQLLHASQQARTRTISLSALPLCVAHTGYTARPRCATAWAPTAHLLRVPFSAQHTVTARCLSGDATGGRAGHQGEVTAHEYFQLHNRMLPEVQEHWERVASSCTEPHLQQYKAALVMDHPLGILKKPASGSGAPLPWYRTFLDLKLHHPRSIILVQVSDAFEAYGFDALVVMEVLQLPCSSTNRLCCKLAPSGLLEDVSRLLARGHSVVALEECKSHEGQRVVGTRAVRRKRFFSPHEPLYLPDSGHARDDRMLFASHKPILGISWGGKGFSVYKYDATYNQVVVWHQQSPASVMTHLTPSGVSPPVLLHASVEQAEHPSLPGNLQQLSDNQGLESVMYHGQDPLAGFITHVCGELVPGLDPTSVKVVPSHQSAHGAPQPPLLSTITQLGLTPDANRPSLAEALLPDTGYKAPVLLEYFRDQLLLPRGPRHAQLTQGVLRQLSSITWGMETMRLDMPAIKIKAALTGSTADATFFRLLCSVLQPVLNTMRDARMAELWQHALPLACMEVPQPGAEQQEPSLASVQLQLQACINEIEGTIRVTQDWDLQTIQAELRDREVLHAGKVDTDSAGGRTLDTDKPEQGPGAAGMVLPRLRCMLESSFRTAVQDSALGDLATQVDLAWAEVEAAADEVLHVLQQEYAILELQVSAGVRTKAELSQPYLELGPDKDVAWVQFTARSHELAAVMASHKLYLAQDSQGHQIKGGNSLSSARLIKALAAHREACRAAAARAAELQLELCRRLTQYLPVLLLANHCGLQLKALSEHCRAASAKQWSLPTLVDDKSERLLQLDGLTPYYMDRGDINTVANDWLLKGMALLTGANMGGKSTCLVSVCAAALLGNCGLYVPAKEATIPWFSGYHLRSYSGDSPLEGKSAFAVECADLVQVLDFSDPMCLILMDEFGKGTEKDAATSIAAIVLQRLCLRASLGIFATHLHDVVPITEHWGLSNLCYRRMEVTADPQAPGFMMATWKVLKGACYMSLALDTSRRQGVPAKIVQFAEQVYLAEEQGRYDKPTGPQHTAAEEQRAAYLNVLSDSLGVAKEAVMPGQQQPTEDSAAGAPDAAGLGTGPGAGQGQQGEVRPMATDPMLMTSKSLQDAVAVLQRVTTQHLLSRLGIEKYQESVAVTPAQAPGGAVGSATLQPWAVQVVGESQTPPPMTASRATVYVVQYATGRFYAGQTADITERLKEHRRKHRVPGRTASVTYTLLPASAPEGTLDALEKVVIAELRRQGFDLVSDRDAGRTRMAR